jgi:phosphatidate phosphatase APP1
MIEFYDGDDLIMRIDPTDIGVISAIYDTVMDTWKKFDENEYY